MSRIPTKAILNYVVTTFLFLTAILGVGRGAVRLMGESEDKEVLAVDGVAQTPVVLIDPGHGGEDGGAIGVNGAVEKELNLGIADNVRDILTLFGIPTAMTREGDHMLYDYYNDLDDYTGKRKTYDLRNRLKIAESSGATLYLGIHMNKFSQEQYSGLQVYYSVNHGDSQRVAGLIREYTRTFLQPDNDREAKAATSSIYILHRIAMPAVLVECGFLSNEAECARLSTAEYRMQLASTIAVAGAEWLAGQK